MTIQTNLPVAPRFARAINAENMATPLTRALAFVGGLLGFDIGVRVREAFARPSGFGIREYCASTTALVELTDLGNGISTVKVVETCLIPGNVKSRDLMVIAEAVSDMDLEAAKERGEAVAIGFNAAYREIQALTNADLDTVNNMIEQAIGVQLAAIRAAKAQEAAPSAPDIAIAAV